MAVHIFDAEDSDGDSWMEVLEGSPGPSMQNSRVSLIYGADEETESTQKTASCVVDDTWVSDFEGYKDIKGDYDKGECADNSSIDAETLPSDKAQLVTDPRHLSTEWQLDQKLRLDCPEVGDIIRHFNEVQGLATAQPRKGLYYRLWLCWMYRTEWPQIEHMAQHAPDYIIQVVNHWFGLRNHPFWTAGDKCPDQWFAMYGACLDIWEWWDKQSRDAGDDNNKTTTNSRHRAYDPSSAPQVATRHFTFDERVVKRDDRRPESSTTLQLPENTSKGGDNLSFVVRTYRFFAKPRPNQAGQRAIPFQTWIHWIHQVNLQPPSKQWAGHDLWPSASLSPSYLALRLPSQELVLKNIGEVAHEYVQHIGLPYKAAAYYQSVSYI